MIALGRVIVCIGLLCIITSAPRSTFAADEVILVLGDSLSAGYGIGIEQSWPALMQQRLAEHGYPQRIENASISGETSLGGVNRLASLLERYRPELVIVELGANDGLRGIAVSEAERHLRKILEMIEAAGARALLFEMHVPPNYGPAYAAQFDELYARLGDLDGVVLVPFFLEGVVLNRALMQNDGLHPNAAAQPIILDNVWKYVEDNL
jgi:acyl-CoA thioesterase-1